MDLNQRSRLMKQAIGMVILGWMLGSAVAWSAGPETHLLEVRPGLDVSRWQTQDATVSVAQTPATPAVRVQTGHTARWPGVTVPGPADGWNLTARAEVQVRLRNPVPESVRVHCRVDNAGADGSNHCVTESLGLKPGATGVLRVGLRRTMDDTLGGVLFGMRGYPVILGGVGTVDPGHITQLLLFVSEPKVNLAFEVLEIRAVGNYTPPTASVTDATPYLPMIDRFGQYRHREWPGKIHSEVELVERGVAEQHHLRANAGPTGWDRFGGWAKGPRLAATGFFRTAKHEGKWWLVDPDGRLFFSHGVDCVRAFDVTVVEERTNWFEENPLTAESMRGFVASLEVLKGHYAGRRPQGVSFAGANLRRKYGPDWPSIHRDRTHQRLRSWGLNTIGNWSDRGTYAMHQTPYTDQVDSRGSVNIEGSEGYWGKFPDVFDPSFASAVAHSMDGKRGGSAGDSWCIGYFSDNEMSWGDEVSLSIATLVSPPGQASKQVLVQRLRNKYHGIEELNAVWGTTHASWDALLQSRQAPDRGRARPDLIAFYAEAAARYFRVVRDSIKAVAPHQLYLGCRFAWVNETAARVAGDYCDVVSYNLYTRSVADFQYPGPDTPLIIGEFHFGALDRGLFHTGLVPVPNQEARAEAYRSYVLGAVRHPRFVGTHWFQWGDEPTTGRAYDEENYQIGLIDIADTPYTETVAATRSVGDRMYRERLGR